MSNKISGIYAITSKINGNRYIGSSVRVDRRWNLHKNLLNNNKHHSPYLQNHFNKYGSEDLVFTVVEVIDSEKLSSKEIKKILLDREQSYLDNWEECKFNVNKKADSCLGSRRPYSKNYTFNKDSQMYRVYYRVKSKDLSFGRFKTEEEAKNQVEYLNTLNEESLINFHNLNYKNKTSVGVRSKNGCKGYRKKLNNWAVEFTVYSTHIHLGTFRTEEEAKEKADYFKTFTPEDLLKLYESGYKGKPRKVFECKGYSKCQGKWRVRFVVDGKHKYFGTFNTEEEARQKAEEVKKELGILN